MTYLITPEELQSQQDENIVIIDVRSHLQQPDLGFEAYQKAHIPGAYYLHLKDDLSSEVKEHGGSHPLPDKEKFARTVGKFGIDGQTKVVIYDAENDMYAARAWWLMQYIGIKQTFVLNGGYNAWIKAGYDVTTEIPAEVVSTLLPQESNFEIVSMREVKERDLNRTVLLDSRAYDRYLGNTEPLYSKAGHIPGAKSYFWKDVLDEHGKWKNAVQLKDQFKELTEADEIIVSCGSGISACPNILALKMAGFDNVKLYPGSFSDWISYTDNPVEKTEE